MIPTAVLPQTAVIEDYLGTTGQGAQAFAAPDTVRCRDMAKRRTVRNANGVDIIAESSVLIRPRSVPVESRVTIGDDVYEVAGTVDHDELGRPHSTELILTGPRVAS